jgi:hypothetical protein
MTSHELIAPKAGIPIPGYLPVPSWIPTLPKLSSILGFSQRLLWPFFPIAIKAKNNLLSSAHGIVESLEQSTVLSEQKKRSPPWVCNQQYGLCYFIWWDSGTRSESVISCATPKFYEFAQPTATHPMRPYARKLPPQSNILGWAGLIMSSAMYGLLTTTPFRLPTDPGPLAIFFPNSH